MRRMKNESAAPRRDEVPTSRFSVGDVRCEGGICAIELVEDFATRKPFPIARRVGFNVCQAARQHGLLTRNIADVLVLMPPFCITPAELDQAVDSLWKSLCESLPAPGV